MLRQLSILHSQNTWTLKLPIFPECLKGQLFDSSAMRIYVHKVCTVWAIYLALFVCINRIHLCTKFCSKFINFFAVGAFTEVSHVRIVHGYHCTHIYFRIAQTPYVGLVGYFSKLYLYSTVYFSQQLSLIYSWVYIAAVGLRPGLLTYKCYTSMYIHINVLIVIAWLRVSGMSTMK